MSYNGPLPQVVKAGGTGAVTLTGVVIGNGTAALTASTITQHDVLLGGVSNAITSLSPSSTGFVLTSNGPGVDPSFQPPAITGALFYYFTNTASSVAGELQQTATTFTPKTTQPFAALGSGTTLLETFITNAGVPNLQALPAGFYEVHVHADQTVGSRNMQLFAEIWEASSLGVDIAKIGTTGLTSVLNGVETEYVVDFSDSSTYVFASTASRIKTKIFASGAVAGSNATVNIFVGDEADSHTTLPGPSADVTNFVPYTGAVSDVNLGSKNLTANTATLTSLTGILTANGASPLTASAVTQFGVLCGGASNAVSSTGVGATGQVLQGNSGANPTYSTATYPSVATTTGTILRADGTNWVRTTATYPATTTADQILYSSATNTIGEITAGIDGVLVSSHVGVPSWLANSGTPGFVLTANAGAPPSWQAGTGTFYSLSPYIVGSDIHSQFATIGAAITQAIADGASATNQKNIYIKPGTYNENITLSDGINLIGFSGQGSLGSNAYVLHAFLPLSVIVTGTITCSPSASTLQSKIIGVNFTVTGATNLINCTGSTTVLQFQNCSLIIATGAVLSVTSGVANISFHGCNITDNSNGGGGSGGKLVVSSVSASSIILQFYDSYVTAIAKTSFVSTTNFSITADNTSYTAFVDLTNARNVAYVFTNCQFNDNITFGASTTGTSFFYQSRIIGMTITGNTSSAFTITLNYCIGVPITSTTATNFNNVGYVIQNVPTNETIETKLVSAGYNGSSQFTKQATAHTTDATVTTLASVTVNELDSITLKGTIIGSTTDHTNSVGGDFIISAMRATAGNVTLIGAPVVNINSSSAATFTCDVDTGTQTVRIRITGVAATIYNWVTTYSYQKVLLDT